jgi:Zn-dependent protease
MKWSLSLGRIAGIRLLVHWTFLILLAWVVFTEVGRGSNLPTILFTIFFVLCIFGCVVLHELGHSLTARRFGIDTKKITLLPIGGVASLERMPDDPKQELLVAVAGPAVNVVIAIVLYLVILATGATIPTEAEGVLNSRNFLWSLLTINIILVVFNAIPAFPMDGGRVLRALLALRIDRVRATQIAASIGQFIAIGFVFVGIFYNPFLVLIGIFVYFGAQSENVMVQHLEFLKGHTVREAMMTNFTTLPPDATVKDAVDQLLAGSDTDFIVADGEQVLGIITRATLIGALKEGKQHALAQDIMLRDFETFDVRDKMTNVYARFQRRKHSFFPVVEDRKLIGAINMENVNEFIMVQSALNY